MVFRYNFEFMIISDITRLFRRNWHHLHYAEDFDNVGLLIGNYSDTKVTGVSSNFRYFREKL